MRSLLAVLAAACCTLPAQAKIVTYEYTAEITRLIANDYYSDAHDVSSISITPRPITLGDKITGRFSIDTANTDIRYFNNLDIAVYGSSPNPVRPSTTINDSWGWTGEPWTGYYTITNAKNYQTFDRFEVVHSMSNGGPQVQVVLTDPSATVFAHRGPPADLDLADFAQAEARLFYGAWPEVNGIRTVGVYSTLTGLQRLAPVPEPETYAMLLAGMAVVVAARRRSIKAA